MAEIHFGATLSPSKLEILQGWMGSQRWYAGKGRHPNLERLAAWRLGDPEGEVGVETLIVADDSGPETVVYQVPLTYRGAPLASIDHALIGTMEHSALGTRWVYDAPHDPLYAALVLELTQGRVQAESSSANDEIDDRFVGEPCATWTQQVTVRSSRVLSGEQSNTSIILDGVGPDGTEIPLIVKVFRMLSAGDNPDVVLQSALVAAGSHHVPAVLGSVRGQWPEPGTDGEHPAYGHLAFAQEFLPGVEDAWRVAVRAAEEGTDFTEPAQALGAATAEVHRMLAAVLGSEPTSSAEAAVVLASMRDRFADAVLAAPELATLGDAVESMFASAEAMVWPARQRIHGDYHLGQVLRSPDRGWILLDFEGEPLRPLLERSQPDQWMRDVAGMLRSFDYVGGSWEIDNPGSARPWVAAAQEAFLDGYAAESGADPRRLGALLTAFELDKAMYEVVYEARNRPDWLAIPIAAVHRLTDHFTSTITS